MYHFTDTVNLPGYFNSLSNALEMRVRTRSVNDKITYAAEVSCESVTYALTHPSSRCNLYSANY